MADILIREDRWSRTYRPDQVELGKEYKYGDFVKVKAIGIVNFAEFTGFKEEVSCIITEIGFSEPTDFFVGKEIKVLKEDLRYTYEKNEKEQEDWKGMEGVLGPVVGDWKDNPGIGELLGIKHGKTDEQRCAEHHKRKRWYDRFMSRQRKGLSGKRR